MKIRLLDPNQFPTEATAMLQALYSRSKTSVDEHIDGKAPEELESAMKKFYVGYGHKSIGDCASTTLFIENVSILAAKAIQSIFCYKGQESSTRYIDFRLAGYVTPEGLPTKLNRIQEDLLDLYELVRDGVYEHLLETKERPEGVKESVWFKTLGARSFDVARGWLPPGVRTNLSLHLDLRQLSDLIEINIHHPILEVREIMRTILDQLIEAYPSSFSSKVYEDTAAFYEANCMSYAYGLLSINDINGELPEGALTTENEIVYIDNTIPAPTNLLEIAESRPEKALLPNAFKSLGEIELAFALDYASFRDLHRHRSAYIPNVVLTPNLGMHSWYIGNLPESIREEVEIKTNDIQVLLMDALKEDPESVIELQYLIPMGFKVPVNVTLNLQSMIYILELRSSRHVHQTLRDVISSIAQRFHTTHGSYKLYIDEHDDGLDPRRGEQDIVRKQVDDEKEFRERVAEMPEREPDAMISVKVDADGNAITSIK